MRKKFGFTLAEVLITLGIIGVVAAITIPILNNVFENIALMSAFKKNYSILSQANNTMVNDNGGTLSNIIGGYKVALGSNLKYTKYCPTASYTNGCWHETGNALTNTGVTLGAPTNQPQTEYAGEGYILNDGTLITFYGNWATGLNLNSFTGTTEPIYTELIIDINGFKKPNIAGKDIFCFFPSNKGLLPFKAGASTGWEKTYTMLLNSQ